MRENVKWLFEKDFHGHIATHGNFESLSCFVETF